MAIRANNTIHVGIDVGSTTTKFVVLDPVTGEVLRREYRRHGAQQARSVRRVLETIAREFPDAYTRVALCGSGGAVIAAALDTPFVQEVVANSIAIRKLHPQVRCAIELGGQDAKMIFFRWDEGSRKLDVADMRMNGSCAGGTGAFVDEIAAVLETPVEQFNELASQGQTVYDISGRCGVYAKTDIQPLLNQGVPRADLALSSLHAIAKQTIGGLAQGLDIQPPVIFEGGPLTFNPTLIRVFAERLYLENGDIVIPEHPETIVALGAALSVEELFADKSEPLDFAAAFAALDHMSTGTTSASGQQFFESEEDREEFNRRHALPTLVRACEVPSPNEELAEPDGAQPAEGALRSSSADSAERPCEDCLSSPDLGERVPQQLGGIGRAGAEPAPSAGCAPSGSYNRTVRAYLGIDSGSTTTKFALLSEDEELLDEFYANNEGRPLDVGVQALKELRDRYRDAGIDLQIVACGTTGYGELLYHRALHAEYHTVETVAHATAATKYVPDATFILDIGGQDMKAIWLDNGIVSNITVNEACSSGCGSFLENFAASLHIPTKQIAASAFRSDNPAVLGSRCTVFMNSSIVSEQKNGKNPDDIMAGLCRSIIENVFTKVIRVSNLASLGERIVVQGGTFNNDAVLRALEQYLELNVTRAPYPGLMGAIGAALLTKRHVAEQRELGTYEPSFIGLDALDDFSYTERSNVHCRWCGNHCNRTLITFGNGSTFVTGNRCERGQVLGDPKDAAAREQVAQIQAKADAVPNLFTLREELLFKDYDLDALAASIGVEPPAHADNAKEREVIGLPRVLGFWDRMPFWNTLLRALGFTVKMSRPSSRKMYENGLHAVPSDTVCFPAKLVHGHLRDLVRQKVERIFFPIVTTIPSENTQKTSESMCAVVKGYPIVIHNSDNPLRQFGVPFDNPLFHWYNRVDRNHQLRGWFKAQFGIGAEEVTRAIKIADAAQQQFRSELLAQGERVIAQVEERGGYALVLASRPYHNDELVNHGLPQMFTQAGIPVLPPDAVPGATDVDLSKSRIDIVNNFHARMLSTALIAAESDHLEYAQVVSFGCGHDAYLSDEIIRLMHLAGGKTPLVVKVDESDNAGPLRIRVRSFVETIELKRKLRLAPQTPRHAGSEPIGSDLPDPYPVKFTAADREQRTVLVPNTSHLFSRMMAAVFAKQGLKAVAVDIGREEAIRLGKKYVHNDICFPAQIVIGEMLAELESGKYDLERTAVATGKYIGDCRLTHYGALLRKALDDAGFEQVPIITNDDVDYHDLHPGFKMNLASAMRIAHALPMIDILEELLRKIRPYECVPGSANMAFEIASDALMEGLEQGGISGAKKGFKRAIQIMKNVRYDRSVLRPTVLIVGEYLLNFHPGANHDIEDYLEANGLEIIEARMTDVIRKTYFYKNAQIKEYKVNKPLSEKSWFAIADGLFDRAHDVADKIAAAHPLYTPAKRMDELVKASDPIIHHTFDAGEGVLIPGEILHHAEHGCRAFVILQPFGCLPNHIVGRGIAKRLKELYPSAQILPLDYDPDVSFANVENRLQMLIMNATGASA